MDKQAFLKNHDIEIFQDNGFFVAKVTFKRFAKCKDGQTIDLTIYKHVTSDGKNIANNHVFAFDKEFHDDSGDNIWTLASRISGSSGRQTAYYSNIGKEFQISLKPQGFQNGMNTEEWFWKIYTMLSDLLKQGKKSYGICTKANQLNVAIIGVGGTGSTIAEIMSNIELNSLTLVDHDKIEQKNLRRFAFCPGKDDIDKYKVDFIKEKISWKVQVHAINKTFDEWSDEFEKSLDFVFISVDDNNVRRKIIEWCNGRQIKFIDSGVWIENKNEKFSWLVRSSMLNDCDVLQESSTNGYKNNTQIFPLNSLNASIAVMMFLEEIEILRRIEKYEKIEITSDFQQLIKKS